MRRIYSVLYIYDRSRAVLLLWFFIYDRSRVVLLLGFFIYDRSRAVLLLWFFNIRCWFVHVCTYPCFLFCIVCNINRENRCYYCFQLSVTECNLFGKQLFIRFTISS